jgi:hypothetical protein
MYLGFSFWASRLVPPEQQTDIQTFHNKISGTSYADRRNFRPRLPNYNSTLENLSSVDFFACCGLGHRLVRQSLAAYVAKQRSFALRAFWGWCGEKNPVEVFSYLFRPQPDKELQYVTSQGMVLPFYNEVPGFPSLVRKRNNSNSSCQCTDDKIESDLDFYTSLRDRFREKKYVDDFIKIHFSNATVIGIHVRSGNGEGGDFERKGRNIEDPDVWVRQVRTLIQTQLLLLQTFDEPPVLYIATDTPSMVKRFEQLFAEIQVPVFDLPQQGRRVEGGGVLFGEGGKVQNKGDIDKKSDHDDFSLCLRGWSDTLTDMMLLSHADIIIAGRPSSFVQTLPMSLAFGKTIGDRKLRDVYCEIVPRWEETSGEWVESDPTIKCFDSYKSWCCDHSTWIKFHHTGPQGHQRIISREFLRFPTLEEQQKNLKAYKSSLRERAANCPRPRRGRAGGGLKDKCLPHEWLY